MCENTNNESCQCIAEILKVIDILQQKADCCDACLDTCDRGFLGCGASCLSCNTRPVMLYTCCGNGAPWAMSITKDNSSCSEPGPTSCVFRIEKLDGCCATFRILVENPDPESGLTYVATNTFFTMNLNCCCALRCLPDTYIECI